MGFDEFMNLALYYPKLGYYRSNTLKFGAHGDFTTAPETSDLFGFCLARQCVQVFSCDYDILEFGAGNGVLATQILFELGRLERLPQKYYILELSASLKYQQQQTIKKVLPELLDRVVWLDTLPADFIGVVLANEVLDAMPAKRLIYKDKRFMELGVDYQNQQFEWCILPTKPHNLPAELADFSFAEDYITEINPQSMAWIETLFGTMKDGVLLLIDYGMSADEYFHPKRQDGTLRCYHQHKAHSNPFINIGNQDISTSVNFSLLAHRAKSSGFAVRGYATQALFLMALGIDEYLSQEKDEQKRQTLTQQVKQLVLPDTMGENFKVLALAKNNSVKLRGFKEQNLAHRL